MTLSSQALDLIKQFEGCRLDAYQDSVGVWTIGWGHTGKEVHAGMVITQELADVLLTQDGQAVAAAVSEQVKVTVSQAQFDALVSFAYNLGVGALAQSTLLKLLNGAHYVDAALEFPRWVHAGSLVLLGLVRRRFAEASLFLEGTT